MDLSTQNDFKWLLSDDATEILRQTQEAIDEQVNVVRISNSLRAKTSPTRAALVMEQAQLRARARRKFKLANEMFFTRRGLEQSTDERIAQYKAHRFVGLKSVADICCGIGGDLGGLLTRSGAQRTIGVDADQLTCLFANHNAGLMNRPYPDHEVQILHQEFATLPLASLDGLHCDPDRRMTRRTVEAGRFSPSLDEILAAISPATNIAIKVAPATVLPSRVAEPMEREWIGDRRECKQQIIWHGPFAKRPRHRTATCIDRRQNIFQFSVRDSEVDQTIEMARDVGPFLFEPHPCVLAAGLADAISNRYQIGRFSSGVAYLTGDHEIENPLLAQFEVVEILPLRIRPVVQFLKRHDVGTVEVKKRGIDEIVFNQFQRLKIAGPNKATLILTRLGKRRVVIVARRHPDDFELAAKEIA